MSTKRFPINYSPPKVLLFASFSYGNPKINVIKVERETEKMFIVNPEATRTLIGGVVVHSFKVRIKKKKVAVFDNIPDALQWLWVKAVDEELACKKAYESAAERVDQLETCIDQEAAKPGILLQLIAEVESQRQRAQFVQLQEVSE